MEGDIERMRQVLYWGRYYIVSQRQVIFFIYVLCVVWDSSYWLLDERWKGKEGNLVQDSSDEINSFFFYVINWFVFVLDFY